MVKGVRTRFYTNLNTHLKNTPNIFEIIKIMLKISQITKFKSKIIEFLATCKYLFHNLNFYFHKTLVSGGNRNYFFIEFIFCTLLNFFRGSFFGTPRYVWGLKDQSQLWQELSLDMTFLIKKRQKKHNVYPRDSLNGCETEG